MAQTAGRWAVLDALGFGPLDAHGTTPLHPLGTRVKARDTGATAYGDGEFIYLGGLDATVVGTPVLVKDDYTTSLLAARDCGAVALALAATVTGEYGWYQTRGKGVAAAGTIAGAGAACYITAGAITTDATEGDQVIGMRTASAASDSQVVVNMGRPAAVADFDDA